MKTSGSLWTRIQGTSLGSAEPLTGIEALHAPARGLEEAGPERVE